MSTWSRSIDLEGTIRYSRSLRAVLALDAPEMAICACHATSTACEAALQTVAG
jgi:hypothetical protein